MSGLDTLVFYLCEYDIDLTLPDMQLFVLYDFESSQYAVYGHRKPTKGMSKETKVLYAPFYFMAKKTKHVIQFINSLLEKNNYFTYALYSFNQLPSSASEMSFKLLYKYLKQTRELSAFDNQVFSETRIRDMIRNTKRVYSMYEFPLNEVADYDESEWPQETEW